MPGRVGVAGVVADPAAVDRLYDEFTLRVPLSTIHAVVEQCVHDLALSPALATPELVERLARQRLSVLHSER